MPWVYVQTNGKFFFYNDLITTGYSGKGKSKNKPEAERLGFEGPIPAGQWAIGSSKDDEDMGPMAIALSPVGHSAWGRTNFYIHGDSRQAPGTASEGCIILPREVRDKVDASSDRVLYVTATDADNPYTYQWSVPQPEPITLPVFRGY